MRCYVYVARGALCAGGKQTPFELPCRWVGYCVHAPSHAQVVGGAADASGATHRPTALALPGPVRWVRVSSSGRTDRPTGYMGGSGGAIGAEIGITAHPSHTAFGDVNDDRAFGALVAIAHWFLPRVGSVNAFRSVITGFAAYAATTHAPLCTSS